MSTPGDGFPTASLPLYVCPVTSGALPMACTDLRTALSSALTSGGLSGAVNVACSSTGDCAVDIVPGTVPLLSGANAFTGLNTFGHLRLPSGGAPDALTCAQPQTPVRCGWRRQPRRATNCMCAKAFRGGVFREARLTSRRRQTGVHLFPARQHAACGSNERCVEQSGAPGSGSCFQPGSNREAGLVGSYNLQRRQSSDWDLSNRRNAGCAKLGPGHRQFCRQRHDYFSCYSDPGYYYFAWSVDNMSAKLAGSGTGTMTGLFNRVSASPAQATCVQLDECGRLARKLHYCALAGNGWVSGDRSSGVRTVGRMRLFIFLSLIATALTAQPVFSNLKVTTSHGSVVMRVDINNTPGQSLLQLLYGPTTTLGYGTVNVASAAPTPGRTLAQAGLQPRTKYYFRIKVTASTGTTLSSCDPGSSGPGWTCDGASGAAIFTTTGLPADHGEPQLPAPLDTTMPVVDGSTFSVDDSCANLQTQLNACAAADRSLVHQVMIPPTAVCRGTYTLPVKTGVGSNTGRLYRSFSGARCGASAGRQSGLPPNTKPSCPSSSSR